MRLKSFHAPTLNEAMRLVRDTLGADAIIVATRDDETGGVRVTAAIDDPPIPSKPVTLPEAANDIEAPEVDVVEIVATALLRHQVPNVLAERFLATATQSAQEDPVLALGAAFEAHLKFQPTLHLQEGAAKPLVLIGPPGAGKTLCVAKLATQATLGKRTVAVISTDTERAGGMEQLAAFTRLLKISLMEIEDAHALREAVAMQPPHSAILIDTAGCNPFSAAERDQLRPLVAAAGGEAVLVLPADLDANEAIDMAQEFRKLGATRLLTTRLDMTRRLGSLLRLGFETRMPLMLFSASAKVTEAPQPLNAVTLARLVLAENDGSDLNRSM